MAKALWFLLKPALLMVGTLTLIYPVLVLLCLVTGWNSFLFTYVQGFFMLFDIIIGICAAQAASAYAPLALSFGVTRRSLRGAMAAFFVLLCLTFFLRQPVAMLSLPVVAGMLAALFLLYKLLDIRLD